MDKEAAREKALADEDTGLWSDSYHNGFNIGFDAGWKAHDWRRIETEDDLPKEDGIYAVVIPGLEGKLEVQYDAFHANSKSWAHYRGHKAWLPLPPFTENDRDCNWHERYVEKGESK